MERRIIRPGAAPAPPWRDRDADDDYGGTATPNWRETDWSRELKRVEIDGTPVNYVDVGSGERGPVVLVHGLGGQWQNWLENIPRLALDRRVVAIDLPGFGLTPEPEDEELSIPGYGRCVDALCEQARARQGRTRRQLDGRLRRRRGGDPVPGASVAARAGLGRRASRARTRSRRPILTFGRMATAIATNSAARHRHLAARRSRATCRSRWWPATRACSRRTSRTRASSRAPASRASTTPCAPGSTTTSATACPR